MKTITKSAKAYAKINLHLRVINKRKDGYHNIFSLMTNIEVFDLLNMTIVDSDGTTEINPEIINDGGTNTRVLDQIAQNENIVYKATQLYFKKKISDKIHFKLQKNIPSGAGLGGGSSDAATALKLLNSYYKYYTNEDLIKQSASIGADVPFCINGGAAFCKGIGEKIEMANSHLTSKILLVNDNLHVNTKEAYKLLNRKKVTDKSIHDIERQKQVLTTAILNEDYNTLRNECINDFEAAVFRMHPKIEYFKKKLYQLGSNFSIMTGSGSTVVGLFSSNDSALKAKALLEKEAKQVLLTDFHN